MRSIAIYVRYETAIYGRLSSSVSNSHTTTLPNRVSRSTELTPDEPLSVAAQLSAVETQVSTPMKSQAAHSRTQAFESITGVLGRIQFKSLRDDSDGSDNQQLLRAVG